MKRRHVRAFNIPPLKDLTDEQIDKIAGPLVDAIAADMPEPAPAAGRGEQGQPRLAIESEGALLGPRPAASSGSGRLIVEADRTLLGRHEPATDS